MFRNSNSLFVTIGKMPKNTPINIYHSIYSPKTPNIEIISGNGNSPHPE